MKVLFIYSINLLIITTYCQKGMLDLIGLGHKINPDLSGLLDQPVLNASVNAISAALPALDNLTHTADTSSPIKPPKLPIINELLDTVGAGEDTKIVGGSQTGVKHFPWMAGIMRRSKSKPFCGGSLISQNTILTAAHCVRHESAGALKIRLGADTIGSKRRNRHAQDFGVRSISVHPNYQYPNNDVAIVRLNGNVRYNSYIKPISLPSGDPDYRGSDATVAGWGTTSYGGRQSRRLRMVGLKVWDTGSCNSAIKDFPIGNGMICAGGSNGARRDACQGDSGGPLMHHGSNGWSVIGIVSFGDGCGKPNIPGVYTRVSKYSDWIKRNM